MLWAGNTFDIKGMLPMAMAETVPLVILPCTDSGMLSVTQQMPYLDQYQAPILAKRLMLTEVRTAQPAYSRIVAVLIRESTVQHQNFFSPEMPVRIEVSAGSPLHQGRVLPFELVQRHYL